jgi:hypothetical protein
LRLANYFKGSSKVKSLRKVDLDCAASNGRMNDELERIAKEEVVA